MDEKENYTFVREKIKEKPISKTKLIRKTVVLVGSAVLFGFVACLTFLLLEPIISNRLTPQEIEKVEIYEEEEEETNPEELLTEALVIKQEQDSNNESEEQLDTKIDEKITEKIESEASDTQIAITSYQAAYDALYEVAMEASKSVVTVTGVSKDTDWFLNEVENINETSGVIVAKTDSDLYILADINGLPDAETYKITINDSSKYEVNLLQADSDTGLGIFTVSKSAFSAKQWTSLQVITLASSRTNKIVGRPIVAVGSPLGQSGSICYGIITSKTKELNFADYHYGILTTDITGSETNSSGIIVDTTGKLLGVITSASSSGASGALLACFGISDIRDLIEELSNNEERLYLGIYGAGVTEEIHAETGIPYGVYVTEVDQGSPAVRANISNGDIITGINGVEIVDFSGYEDALHSLNTEDTITISLYRYNGWGYSSIETELKAEAK